MEPKRRILLVLPSLNAGGAQGVIVTLLKHLSRTRFEVCLAVVDNIDNTNYQLPLDINVCSLNRKKSRHAVPDLVSIIRRGTPALVFSTLGYFNLLVILTRPFLPSDTVLVARETNIPSRNLSQSPYPRLLSFLYKVLYPKFDLIICQSEDMKNDLVTNFHIPPAKILIINNPVDTAFISRLARKPGQYFPQGRINLLAAGKLMYQKGFDLLLQAFAQLDRERFHLTILGSGSEELALKQLAQDLGVFRRITFAGFQQNPYPYMAQADLFVLSSRFEGFPNVVLEAHACGTPVVAFACPGGLKEIIKEAENGLLAQPEDHFDLARKINEAVKISWDKNEIVSSVTERYGIERIVRQYEEAFESVLG